MGNSTSQQRPSTIQRRTRDSSSTLSTTPHTSLTTRKKSLELPDLASLTAQPRGRPPHSIPPKSASIPIPVGPHPALSIPGEAGRTRAPITLPSNTDVHLFVPHHEHRQVFPPPSRNSRRQQQQQRQQHIQELYNQSQAPPSPENQSSDFEPEIVYSTIPIALSNDGDDGDDPLSIEGPPELFTVKITWRGGGKSVYLARASDDEWNGRLEMTQDAPGSDIYNATVSLPRGTHHIRFLIDDLWRVAGDLPTAVDDQGSLANYITAPSTDSSSVPSSPPITSTSNKSNPDRSFWSAASSNGDENGSATQDAQGSSTARHDAAVWTSIIPEELIDAAKEEEAYLAASEGQPTIESGTQRVQGFVPAPQIPPAPGLPRHLGKLILNDAKTTLSGAHTAGSPAGSSSGRRAAQGRERERETERERERERDQEREQERERDRDRDREIMEREDRDRRRERDKRGNPPPPPPPSEVGTADFEPSPPQNLAPISTIQEPSTSPITSTPASPLPGDVDPTPPAITPSDSQSALPIVSTDTSIDANADPSSTSTPAGGSTAASTAVTTPIPSMPSLTLPPLPSSRPLTLSLETSTPALMDDASVLPVPSHVVLHHLSTSAIKNGVLAVGNTTRYRKKYLSTIYYKPT